MADILEIVDSLAAEFGKTGSQAKAKIEAWAGEVAVDLLSQDEGRFKLLEETEVISINTTDKEYMLPVDFNTAKETFIEVDDDGDYRADCAVVAKSRIHRAIAEGKYTGFRLTYIKKKEAIGSTPGYYLVLTSAATQATTFEFDYYRNATPNDIHIIRNASIIKNGVRGLATKFHGSAAYYAEIYRRQRQGFHDAPERYMTHLSIQPTRRIVRHNRQMKGYGGGL